MNRRMLVGGVLVVIGLVPAGLVLSAHFAGAMSAAGVSTVSVNRIVERSGVKVGLNKVRISDDATALEAWFDPGEAGIIEPLGSPKLLINGTQTLSGEGGAGNRQPSQIEFGPLPENARTLTWQQEAFWATESRTLQLSLPIAPYLEKVAEAREVADDDMEIPMDIAAGVDGREYTFTLLRVSRDGFTLVCVPRNTAAAQHPLKGPYTPMTITDDDGNVYGQTVAFVDLNKDDGYLTQRVDLTFVGEVDLDASIWTLEVSNPGVILQGPWSFEVALQ